MNNKEEFLQELEEELQGQVTDQELRENIDYFRGYFAEQENLGYAFSETVHKLGSPRLIARSIIDAHGIETVEEQDGSGYYDSAEERYQGSDESSQDTGVMAVLRKIGGIVLTIVIILLFATVLTAMLPYILVILGVLWVAFFLTRR